MTLVIGEDVVHLVSNHAAQCTAKQFLTCTEAGGWDNAPQRLLDAIALNLAKGQNLAV